MDVEDLFNQLKRAMESNNEPEGQLVAKLEDKEGLRFFEVNAKKRAFHTDARRVLAKLQAEEKRIWFDIQDKYNLHGKNLYFKVDDGSIYEQK